MSWKTWPYWLKGGLTGLLVIIIIAIFDNLILYNIDVSLRNPFHNFIVYKTELIMNLICALQPCHEAGLALFLTLPISYFLYGAIIGFIYGKIKNRSQ